MNLYDLMIALGLFVGILTLPVEHPRGRVAGFVLAAALFLVAALVAGGVIHS